jgi:hypothetical protein
MNQNSVDLSKSDNVYINIIYANVGIDEKSKNHFCIEQPSLNKVENTINEFIIKNADIYIFCDTCKDSITKNKQYNDYFQLYGDKMDNKDLVSKQWGFGVSIKKDIYYDCVNITIPYIECNKQMFINGILENDKNITLCNSTSLEKKNKGDCETIFYYLFKHLQMSKINLKSNTTLIIINAHFRKNFFIYEYEYIFNILYNLILAYYHNTKYDILLVGDFNTKNIYNRNTRRTDNINITDINKKNYIYKQFLKKIKENINNDAFYCNTVVKNNEINYKSIDKLNDHFIFIKNSKLDFKYTRGNNKINKHHSFNINLDINKPSYYTNDSVDISINPKLPKKEQWINFKIEPPLISNMFDCSFESFTSMVACNLKSNKLDNWTRENWIFIDIKDKNVKYLRELNINLINDSYDAEFSIVELKYKLLMNIYNGFYEVLINSQISSKEINKLFLTVVLLHYSINISHDLYTKNKILIAQPIVMQSIKNIMIYKKNIIETYLSIFIDQTNEFNKNNYYYICDTFIKYIYLYNHQSTTSSYFFKKCNSVFEFIFSFNYENTKNNKNDLFYKCINDSQLELIENFRNILAHLLKNHFDFKKLNIALPNIVEDIMTKINFTKIFNEYLNDIYKTSEFTEMTEETTKDPLFLQKYIKYKQKYHNLKYNIL